MRLACDYMRNKVCVSRLPLIIPAVLRPPLTGIADPLGCSANSEGTDCPSSLLVEKQISFGPDIERSDVCPPVAPILPSQNFDSRSILLQSVDTNGSSIALVAE